MLAQAQVGRRLQAKCDASDIVQQTMLEAHRDFASFQGEEEQELMAWLRRILAHNLYNEARHYATQQRNAAREVSLETVQQGVDNSSLAFNHLLQGETPTPSHLACRKEDAIRVAQALAQLPDDYRVVLLLRVFEGMSADEVAQHMDRSAGAVRMLQLRALAALKDLLK